VSEKHPSTVNWIRVARQASTACRRCCAGARRRHGERIVVLHAAEGCAGQHLRADCGLAHLSACLHVILRCRP
jgi:hypothetical protein